MVRLFKKRFAWIYAILVRKYGFDDFNQIVLVHGAQETGHLFYDVSDVKFIDGVCVNGSGSFVRWFESKPLVYADRLYLSLCIGDGIRHFNLFSLVYVGIYICLNNFPCLTILIWLPVVGAVSSSYVRAVINMRTGRARLQ